jgi:hypothetical protein
MMHARTKTILKHCRKPGTYLRKEHQSRCRKGGGGAAVMVRYFLEPGSIEVAAEYAVAAIRGGLVPRDNGLFWDDPDNSQTWFAPLKRPIPSRKSPATKRAGSSKSLHPRETST